MGYTRYIKNNKVRTMNQCYWEGDEVDKIYLGSELVWERILGTYRDMSLTIDITGGGGYQVYQRANNVNRLYTWGDGNTTNSTGDTVLHTYVDYSGEHTITVSQPTAGGNTGDDQLTKVNDYGTMFYPYYVGGTLTWVSGDSKFEGKLNLIEIPDNWFDLQYLSVTSEMFKNCTALPAIPDSWRGLELVEDAEGMFRSCTSLTNLPIKDLTSLAKLTNTRYMFYGCTGVTSDIYPIYEYLNNKDIAVTDFALTFYNCGNATNWEYIPTSWGGGGQTPP